MSRTITAHYLPDTLGELTLSIFELNSLVALGSLTANTTGPGKRGYEWELIGILESLPQGMYDYLITTSTNQKVAGGQVYVLNVDGHYPVDTDTPFVIAMITGGLGQYELAITVLDPSDAPVIDAIVGISLGGAYYTRPTNASGIAVFNVDAGTWTVNIQKSGFDFIPQTIEVLTTTARTYNLSLPPAPPSEVSGQFTVYNELGQPEPNAAIYIQMVQPPPGTGLYDGDLATYTADENGLVTIPVLFVGASYVYWKVEHGVAPPPGCGYATIPADSPPVDLPSILSTNRSQTGLTVCP